MLLEIDGVSCIFLLTDNKALFMKLASDRGYSIIIEYPTQTVYGISVVVCSFQRYIYQICPGNLENLTKQIPFSLSSRTEHFYHGYTVVTVDSFCHKRFQRTALAIKIDDAFLDIGTLLPDFTVYFTLGNLRIECQ